MSCGGWLWELPDPSWHFASNPPGSKCHRATFAINGCYSGIGVGRKAGILAGMDAKPKRAWLQIHLSTAIVLMFISGGLIWANCQVAVDKEFICRLPAIHTFVDGNGEVRTRMGPINDAPFKVYNNYGWPKTMITTDDIDKTPYWKVANTLINTVCGLLCLLFSAAFCEWLIHRREARKQ